MKLRLFSTRGPGLFLQSTHRFPALSSAITLRFPLRSCLPHAIGSSRFGGHCTATGGCSGVVVGGESIFHGDDVESPVGKRSLLPSSSTHCVSSPRCVLPSRSTRHVTTTRIPLLWDRREHPLQDAGRSIPCRRLHVHARLRTSTSFKLHSVLPRV